MMETWTLKRSKHEVMKILAGAGVPCGACLDTGEVMTDPHLIAREMIVEVQHPVRGPYITAGAIVMLLLIGMEIRNHRQRKTLAGIERAS